MFKAWSKFDDSCFKVDQISGGITNMCEYFLIIILILFFGFHHQFNLVRGQLWHRVVSTRSRLQLSSFSSYP
jgi:hypothetical protein